VQHLGVPPAAAVHSRIGAVATSAAPARDGLDPEPNLLRQALAGDAAAREDLARRCGEVAFRFALQLLGDREQARDVAQDAVMRFFATLGRIDPDRPVAPWLLRIVRNRVIDLRRREHSRGVAMHSTSGPAVEVDEPRDGSPGPAERSERRELRRLVWTCLARLEPSHREILVLRDYQDLSYRDIAEVLDVPIGTVMSRLHTARRKLREAVLESGYRFGGAP
jgi:RNA polymerase sigma-70 factor (ECF subfamily)